MPQGSQLIAMKKGAPPPQILKVMFSAMFQQQRAPFAQKDCTSSQRPSRTADNRENYRKNWSFGLTVANAKTNAILSSIN